MDENLKKSIAKFKYWLRVKKIDYRQFGKEHLTNPSKIRK